MRESAQTAPARAAVAIRAAATYLLMTVCALIMLGASVLTLFRARRYYSEWIATPFGRLTLKLWGVRMVVHQDEPFPNRQCVYISNHTSTVDVFILIALGLPNTRFFLSGFLRKVLPLALIGYLVGIFWTVPQDRPEHRRRIFQRAAKLLRHSGESVYLSPEGERITTGEIGHFNKGAFHLATDLHLPIVPLYIAIPRAADPGRAWSAQPTTAHVYVKPAIDTRDWRIEDLPANIERVRNRYLAWHLEHRC